MKRHLYIQKEFQSRIIINFCLLILSGSFLFCLAYYYSLNVKLDGNYVETLDKVRFLKNAFMNRFFILESAVLTFMSVGVVIMTLFMSHSIAGPLWRIEQTAKAVGSGDVSVRIHLREKDEIRGLADQMNKMAETIGSRVKDLNATVIMLDGKVEVLRTQLAYNEPDPDETLRLVQEIRHTSKLVVDKLL